MKCEIGLIQKHVLGNEYILGNATNNCGGGGGSVRGPLPIEMAGCCLEEDWNT